MKETLIFCKYQNKWNSVSKENKANWRKFQILKRQDRLRKKRILQVMWKKEHFFLNLGVKQDPFFNHFQFLFNS